MKLSRNWLASYLPQNIDWDYIWTQLTMAGIEIESITPILDKPLTGVVVSEVVECVKHPESNKLKLCQVNTGSALVQIVCGASNVQVGMKVPCACIGAVLPNDIIIQPRQMGNIVSQGMLCSAAEINYTGDAVDGLLALPADAIVGTDICEYLDLDDQIIEFKITPNRGDCLSIYGILREISALTNYTITWPNIPDTLSNIPHLNTPSELELNITAIEHCSNYHGLIMHGINNQVTLPGYIIHRITRSAVKSISPVVDIANYVMLELGQPLHAFDLDTVGNKLSVRMTNANEKITLLNKNTVTLSTDTLVIGDQNNQPIAIAGIMGSATSSMKATTQSLILESAYFTPAIVANKARYYDINSEAAYRYERGVDPQLQIIALERAMQLITQYCGGRIGQLKSSSVPYTPKLILVKYLDIHRILGITLSMTQIQQLLPRLNLQISRHSTDDFEVTIPSYRFDINNSYDVIEELARLYGYNNIPVIMPVTTVTIEPLHDTVQSIQRCKNKLVQLGYTEVINYAFIEHKYEQILGNPLISAVKLSNPIASLNVLQSSLVGNLIKTFIHNVSHGHKHIKLFEIARVFYTEKFNAQPVMVAGLLCGDRLYPDYQNIKPESDFFDIKYAVELLVAPGVGLRFQVCHDYPVFHANRCAKIYIHDECIGIMGQLHPKIGQALDLNVLPYIFELDVRATHGVTTTFQPQAISLFQKVWRDLAFEFDCSVAVGDVIQYIRDAPIPYLIECSVFDIFMRGQANIQDDIVGVSIPQKEYKSVGLHFVFQADKTLIDADVNVVITQIIDLVTQQFVGSSLRVI